MQGARASLVLPVTLGVLFAALMVLTTPVLTGIALVALAAGLAGIVGIGMRSHAGVAARMFKALADENINIKVISTSEIKISVLIDRKYMELAVQALHDAFELEKA